MKFLDKINSPADVKKLNLDELNILAEEMRETLIKRITTTGGHLGSNLGVIELTIALHYVFNSPKDKIVFDVSHQSYPHKMLTGRREGYTDFEKYYTVSGYTNPDESEHDFFNVGHTSTSVSLAVGLAKARDLKGDKENIIAVIGDGSLSGGQAFEGLNNATEQNTNIIIIFNDNSMSIAENFGGMYKNFKELRDTKGKAENNFFKAFGFDYYFVEDGNNIEQILEVLEKVKDTNKPTLIHVPTLKGKGYDWAIENKEDGHYIFSKEVVEKLAKMERYEELTADFMLEKIKKDKTVLAINAAVPFSVGLTREFRKIAGKQYVDVGIAEEHSVAYASALAKNGAKPVLYMRSTFSQRIYDQLLQDLALNKNAATILVCGGGITANDETHLASFDMSMMSNIPNLICLSPVTKNEYFSLLDWSIEQSKYPVVIRMPNKILSYEEIKEFKEENLFKFEITEQGKDIAILGLGTMYELAKKVKIELKEKLNIDSTLVNPRIYSEIDKNLLEKLKAEHKIIITLEDGILSGGFGQKVASFYGNSDMKVLNYGAEKEFTSLIPVKVLYEKYRLTPKLILEDIENLNIYKLSK